MIIMLLDKCDISVEIFLDIALNPGLPPLYQIQPPDYRPIPSKDTNEKGLDFNFSLVFSWFQLCIYNM